MSDSDSDSDSDLLLHDDRHCSSSGDLWQLLREACKDCHEQLGAFMTGNDGVYAAEEILTIPFVKSRLSRQDEEEEEEEPFYSSLRCLTHFHNLHLHCW